MNWARFKCNSEETFFLFTKLKKDRVIKAPKIGIAEENALDIIEKTAKFFPLLLNPLSQLDFNENLKPAENG